MARSRSKRRVTLICWHCSTPFDLPADKGASEAVWRLRSCPRCKRSFGPAFPGAGVDDYSVPDVIERVALEAQELVFDDNSGDLHLPAEMQGSEAVWWPGPEPEFEGILGRQQLRAQVEPITSRYLQERHGKRAGLPVDILTWVALAAASGVIGGVAYDVVKAAISAAFRRKKAPPRTVEFFSELDNRSGRRALSDSELEQYTCFVFWYATSRVSAVREEVLQSRVGEVTDSSAKASLAAPANTYQPSPRQERRSSPSGRRPKPKRRKSKHDR
jgi:hypothetical protein